MRIYVVRHGAAIDRSDPKCPSEAERYLIAEGMTKTKQVARALAALGIFADVMIASPYVRAWQTAEIFADAFDVAKSKIERTNVLLPGAEPAGFFRELARQTSHRKSMESVMCFGHAPQLDELIAAALGLKKDVTELRKAGVACIELGRIHPPAGKMVWMVTPKAVRKLSKGK